MPTRTRWNVLNVSFLVGTLALAAVLVPVKVAVQGVHWTEVLLCAAMVFAIGTAISAGYHRLFSHRAFQATWPVRFLLLCFGAASFENSALKWASDHRLHHQFVDTEKDPYSITRGFWHAHWLWVMEENEREIPGVADLRKDPLIMWQHRNHFLIGAVVACLPLYLGLLTGHFWAYLVMGLALRIVLTHHTTFLINSAAHVFGNRPYTDANSARDNWVLAPLTYGEGYHNFHHMWQWDYRNGVRWYQWDSTKWLLSVLSWMGLVTKLRRVNPAVMRRARLQMEEKQLRERLTVASLAVATPLQERLAAARLRVDTALASFQEKHEAWEAKKSEWKALGHAKAEQWRLAKVEWKATLAQHRLESRAAWEEWRAARLEVRTALVFT